MKKQYGQVSLTHTALDNAEFYQLVSETKEAVVAFNKGNKQEAMYATNVALLDTLLSKFQEVLHHSRSSAAIHAMEEANLDRGDAFKTFAALVRAFARVKDPDSKAAYIKLSALLKNYTRLSKMSYEKATEAINHLLNALKEEGNQGAVTRLHLTAHVTALAQAQKAFEKAYKDRLAERKGKPNNYTKKLRHEMAEVYDLIVDFTAVYVKAYPDRSPYVNLHQTLNAIRERYRPHHSTKKKEKDEMPTVTERDISEDTEVIAAESTVDTRQDLPTHSSEE